MQGFLRGGVAQLLPCSQRLSDRVRAARAGKLPEWTQRLGGAARAGVGSHVECGRSSAAPVVRAVR
jgi:hypothetical protein